MWERSATGDAVGINHAGQKRKRRQDLEPQYLENGAAYVMRTEVFEKTGERFCGRTVIHVVDADHCLEIHEPLDFLKAEVALRARETDLHASVLPARLGALVMDFDGVLTDNAVYVDQTGTETVRCDRGDGLGLERLRKAGLPLLILSKEKNPVVARRAEKLRIECLHGIDDKPTALRTWAEAKSIPLSEIVYVGNDVNDVDAMRLVGCAACPSDAHPTARAAARIVLHGQGGRGAVRELCDILAAHVDSRRDHVPRPLVAHL